jgi:hypothetical protein
VNQNSRADYAEQSVFPQGKARQGKARQLIPCQAAERLRFRSGAGEHGRRGAFSGKGQDVADLVVTCLSGFHGPKGMTDVG